jgi:asparagine synthase (glutamine-hydrolysing)
MCGIAGFIKFRERESATTVLRMMLESLHHRGPDGQGEWSDKTGTVHFGHRRLAIVDLDTTGAQPMSSPSRRYVVTFNGEIYNFEDLRSQLMAAGYGFRGHSDTEVLAAAVEEWGVEPALGRCRGMFSLAVCDTHNEIVWLARDRLGEKPLYYGQVDGTFLFASELKAIRRHPQWTAAINRDALSLYFRYGYIPGRECIYSGIQKLEPGSLLQIDYSRGNANVGAPYRYWNIDLVAQREDAFRGKKFHDAIDELDEMLGQVVARQMVADVPVGAFLSGGVDSSLMVALMQKISSRPVKTFTVTVAEDGYNEGPFARAVSRHLGTEHTELELMPSQVLDAIPLLPEIYDEPFADSSQIPTYLISKLVRRYVKVSLSGDGGDELFSGYTRYDQALKFSSRVGRFPQGVRVAVARILQAVPASLWQSILGGPTALMLGRNWSGKVGDRVHKLAELLPFRGPRQLYGEMVSRSGRFRKIVIGASTKPSRLELAIASTVKSNDFVGAMSYFDLVSYLPDDILVKVDRAAMAVGLETRAPLLDHHIVEFALGLPSSFKRRDRVDKALLREVLYKYVPRELFERPKKGFAIPLNEWLKGPLRPWAEELLDPRRISQQGFLDAAVIKRLWGEHSRGERFWAPQLWDVLMFQAWLERWERK